MDGVRRAGGCFSRWLTDGYVGKLVGGQPDDGTLVGRWEGRVGEMRVPQA